MSPTTIFAPASTAAAAISSLSTLVIAVTTVIFFCVCTLLVYAVIAFRDRPNDDGSEPVVVGWTVIPVVIVVVLSLAGARVMTGVQNASRAASRVDVFAVVYLF